MPPARRYVSFPSLHGSPDRKAAGLHIQQPQRRKIAGLEASPLATAGVFDYIYIILFIFSVSQAGYYPSSTLNLAAMSAAKEAGQHSIFSYVGTACTLLSLLIALTKGMQVRFAPLPVKIFIGGLCLMLISASWSALPVENLINGGKGVVEVIALYVVATRMGSRSFITAFSLSVVLIGFGSLFLIFTNRDFSVSASDFILGETVQGWRGMFQTKNTLASFALFSFISLIFFFPDMKSSRFFQLALIMALTLLIGSFGKTARACAVMTVAWIFAAQILYRVTRSRKSMALLLVLTALIVPFALVLAPHSSSGELTFTGRSKIWEFYLEAAKLHPILGYGGAAASNPDLAMDAFRTLGQMSAHNSYITVLTDVGVIGVTLYVAWLISTVVLLVRQPNNYYFFAGTGGLVAFGAAAAMEANAAFAATLPIVAILIQSVFAEKRGLKVVTLRGAARMGLNPPPPERPQPVQAGLRDY